MLLHIWKVFSDKIENLALSVDTINISVSKLYFINTYIFIAIAFDETSILVAVHFSMQNIYQSCDLDRALGRSNVHARQPMMFFAYLRLRDVGRVSPWR